MKLWEEKKSYRNIFFEFKSEEIFGAAKWKGEKQKIRSIKEESSLVQKVRALIA